MTIQQWVDFLQNDKQTKYIGVKKENGLHCNEKDYVKKEEFHKSIFQAYANEEVVKVFHQNLPHYTLLIFK